METGLFPLKLVRLYGSEGFVLEGMIDPKIAIATILVAALILFIWGRWRHDVVALAALWAAILVGVVPIDKSFSGFADPAVVLAAEPLTRPKRRCDLEWLVGRIFYDGPATTSSESAPGKYASCGVPPSKSRGRSAAGSRIVPGIIWVASCGLRHVGAGV